MDQHPTKPSGDSASIGTRAEWTAPQVDRLIAGGAEAAAGADIEGLDGLS